MLPWGLLLRTMLERGLLHWPPQVQSEYKRDLQRTEPLRPRPQAPERWKTTFLSSPEVAQALLELSAPVKSGGNESHLGILRHSRQAWGTHGNCKGSVSVGEARRGVACVCLGCTASHWAIPGAGDSFCLCEVLGASHNPDHDRNSAFAVQDTECPL